MTSITEQVFQSHMNPTVLVVDDNRTVRWIVIEQLRHLGLAADEAANGREAVEQVKRTRYNIILMDVDMPELDGLDATRQIRVMEKENGWDPAPIIAYTAGAERNQCLAAGMDDYLQKPVTGEQLSDAIQRWLKVK